MIKANWAYPTCKDLLKAVGVKPMWATERLEEEFEAAMAAMPEDGVEELTAEYATKAFAFYDINQDMMEPFVEQQQIIASSPALTQIFWVLHYCMYMSSDWQFESWGMGMPKKEDGTEVPGFGTVTLLSGLHRSEEAWKRLPKEQIEMEQGQLRWTCSRNPETGNPKWVNMGLMGWNTLYVKGLIMDVGRLTFELNTLSFGVKAYRNKNTGKYVLIAEPGEYGMDGYMPDGECDEDVVVANFYEDDEIVRGNLITYAGQVCRIVLTLNKSEWELVVEDGDEVLSVHISPNGKLDRDAAADSYARARAYFKNVFPDFEPKAYICDSWLLGRELPRFVKDTSNIFLFLKEYYNVPRSGGNEDTLNFLFKEGPDVDLSTLPENSSLQKGIKEWMMSGKIMYSGKGIRFFD
ncbi:MAG: hypothetical protein IKV30_05920 [Clostridia bacterium]|nr:hypothetical protein [Clostridia bacterium]